LYEFPLCCQTSSIFPLASNEYPTDKPIYATTQNDSESLVGGLQKAGTGNLLIKYYYLESDIGAGTLCQAISSGECTDLGLKYECLYEFYPAEDLLSGSHFANCTGGAPHNYPNQMCCQIAEDCTNNIDDDDDVWVDISDWEYIQQPVGPEVFTPSCPIGTVCGITDIFSYPGCNWMNYYCDDIGCDFSSTIFPYISEDTTGFSFFSLTGCSYSVAYDNPAVIYNWDTLSPDCQTFVTDMLSENPSIQSDADSMGISVYELIFRCRTLHCSLGEDPENNPLPAYVQDMETNSYLTRTVCPIGSYWGQNPVSGEYECKNRDECYDPNDVQNSDCKHNYNTEFSDWLNDAYPYDVANEFDCFVSDLAAGANTAACCPVFLDMQDTFIYTDITYYVQQ
jgi:hypothetical protein